MSIKNSDGGNKMLCPKCGKKMQNGSLGPSQKGLVYWARDEFFNSKIFIFMTKRSAAKNGAIIIPVRHGLINHRTKAWACEDCKYVLIDCN